MTIGLKTAIDFFSRKLGIHPKFFNSIKVFYRCYLAKKLKEQVLDIYNENFRSLSLEEK